MKVSSLLPLLLTLLLCLLRGEMLCGAQPASGASPIRVVLPQGTRLIMKPETEGERVAVSLFVRMEPDARRASDAVGEMVARTLFYGNANRTQNSILALAEEVGGSLDVLRGRDYVVVNYVTIPAQLPEALHLLCDCLKSASFAPESLQRAFQSWRAEQRQQSETGFNVGYNALSSLFGSAPDEIALQRVTQAQAQNYFRRHYVPAHTVIAVVGRFDAARVQGMLGAFLADYTRGSASTPAITNAGSAWPVNANEASEAVPAFSDSALVLSAPGQAAFAFVGTPAPSVRSPDYPAFLVLQALLGGGHASRLFREAREMLGLGYEVGAFYPAERFPLLLAYLQWNPQRAQGSGLPAAAPDSIRSLLRAQIADIAAHPPDETELRRARNTAIGQDARRHERARERAFLLGWYEVMGRGYAYDALLPQQLAAVTREDIIRMANTYLTARASVVVLPPTH